MSDQSVEEVKMMFWVNFISNIWKIAFLNMNVFHQKYGYIILFFSFLNWSIVDLQCWNFFCRAKWFSYAYIYILFHILFHYGLLQDTECIVPVLYSRTLLFIHSICNSLHLLVPNSQSIPPPLPFPLGNHRTVLHVCESVSVL